MRPIPRFYAGIGSRKTPLSTCRDMTLIAQTLTSLGYVLRSGHAPGADCAFEDGAGPAQIFLPWDGFNDTPKYGQRLGGHLVPVINEEHERIAREHHPNWGACSNGARLLHIRNVCQILGEHLKSPVEFVICWTPNGSGSGGTGQALRIARSHGIPIYDLGNPTQELALATLLQEMNQ